MPWKKKDTPVTEPAITEEQPVAAEAPAEPTVETPAPRKRRGRPPKAKAAEEVVAEPVIPQPTEPEMDAHHTVSGVNRGRYRFAAWIGLTVILLAIVGLISIIVLGVNLIRNAMDNTDLMNALHDQAYPLTYHQPEEFDSTKDADQALLLRAACFSIVKKEEVRQMRESGENFTEKYKTDEYARYIVSASEVTAEYQRLFGKAAKPTFQNIGSDNQKYAQFEYDKEKNCMYLPGPYVTSTSAYETLADDIRLRGDTARVRIGYVLKSNLEYDDLGRQLDPTAEMAEFFQWFVFEQAEDGSWHITAVETEQVKK